MRQLRRHRKRNGFTLIEVLLVLGILGVIAAMVVPQLLGRQKEANIKATKVSIAGLEGALDMFALDHDGEYPATAQGLEVLLVAPGNDEQWNGPYLKDTKSLPLDAWGNPIQYEYPGQHHPGGAKPDLFSWGPDKQAGTADDISNWQ